MTHKLYLTALYAAIAWGGLVCVMYIYAASSGVGPGDAFSWIGALVIAGGPLLGLLAARAWMKWEPDLGPRDP